MPRFDAFCGPSNLAGSSNVSSEFTMNWMPERPAVPVEGQGTDLHDKNIRCHLFRSPGLSTFFVMPHAPCRGVFGGSFRLFAVGGDHFYEIFYDGTWNDRSNPGFSGSSGVGPAGGTIGNDGLPAQCIFNGAQALVISAGNAYCDSGNGPVQVQFSIPLSGLVIDSADTTGFTLTIPGEASPFDATDVGRTIQIVGGAGFTIGTNVITSVNTTGEAIGTTSWGTPGSTLGYGYELLGKTFTDLHLVSPVLIASDSHPFGADDVGTKLTITSGTGFVTGTYTITGLAMSVDGSTPTGLAILNTTAGAAGSTGGAGSIAAMYVTAFQGAYLDGYYFVIPSPVTRSVYYSHLHDGTMWEPSDVFQKENYPDNVAALFSDHQELYTFGQLQSTQVWRDTGNFPNPFAPDPGAAIQVGCMAPWSVVRLGNGVAWIGWDSVKGARRAYHAVGYNPVPVSTPAVEDEWSGYAQVMDAVAFNYSDLGHEYWVITFPTSNTTWVYDAATQWWHKRGWWNASLSRWERIRPWVHTVVALYGENGAEHHFVGDWSTGNIYKMGWQYKTDDGTPIYRRRRAPHMTLENMRRFFARFEIDCDVLGLQRIFWNRLGCGRDRIWQLDSVQLTETAGVTLTLGFSDDRGQSWQTLFSQSLDPSVDVALANAYLNYVDANWH
jgi:hypothetical protein